jgi:hypothetical protein
MAISPSFYRLVLATEKNSDSSAAANLPPVIALCGSGASAGLSEKHQSHANSSPIVFSASARE